MKTLFEHETINVIHNVEDNYIELVWQGAIELEVYKKALNIVLDYAKKEQINQFLVNQIDLEYVSSRAQAWLTVSWFPKIEEYLQSNLYFAIIPSQKLFVEMASKVVSKQLKSRNKCSIIEFFSNENNALEWLNNTSQYL